MTTYTKIEKTDPLYFSIVEGPNRMNPELLVRIVTSHSDLVSAVKELILYIESNNYEKVLMYPQSIEFAKNVLAKAEGK